jgi:hypothetical protein
MSSFSIIGCTDVHEIFIIKTPFLSPISQESNKKFLSTPHVGMAIAYKNGVVDNTLFLRYPCERLVLEMSRFSFFQKLENGKRDNKKNIRMAPNKE